MAQTRLDNIRQQRLRKLAKLRELGIEAYPAKFERKQTIAESLKFLGRKVQTAGRIRSIRKHGRIAFFDLADSSGQIQLWFQEKNLGKKDYKIISLLDVGDFIGVKGVVVKTKTGQISIDVESLAVLSKSLRPLPDSWHGFKDIEERYRKRYLDLLINDEARWALQKRSLIVQEMRNFLDKQGFLEVETPTLQPLYGGASARPFVTHHNALDADLYLKISDELYLKRLIIGGFEKVYEIDHNFRNEGIDKTHNPEFTMMECYWSYADYNDMMVLTENMIAAIAQKVLGTTIIEFQGKKIDLKPPWRRLTMYDGIREYLGWDPEKISDKEIQKKLKKKGAEIPGEYNRGLAIADLFEEVEPHLIEPTFVTDMPKETTMLCKLHRNNPNLIERFEPYINGWEIGNAYSELNDPQLQRKFFQNEITKKEAGDEEFHPMDEDFIEAMEYGMPPTGGLGIGVDRIVMLLTNQQTIRDVILFPTMKIKQNG